MVSSFLNFLLLSSIYLILHLTLTLNSAVTSINKISTLLLFFHRVNPSQISNHYEFSLLVTQLTDRPTNFFHNITIITRAQKLNQKRYYTKPMNNR
ncbi:hypothetical protein M8C21_001199 [Ambrosia artemisiifolia]|uniref:Uncharacterized protein n=1 Tax=Ambrosia artemisiifolia TaxID=4212 RepID=A0AAD5CHS3_AMBAR|nr:hypothetical protein M8C21_001199 [Ambrosia artemisiifolia]